MKFLPLLYTCLRALTRNPMRAVLTVLGIVIGIAAVVAIMEIGEGSKKKVRESVSSMGADVITASGADIATAGVSSGSAGRSSMYPADADIVMKLCPESVIAATPIVRTSGQAIARGINWSPSDIVGANEHYITIDNWTIEKGQNFTAAMVNKAANVCLIGTTIEKTFFEGMDPIGQEIRVRDVVFKVVGVLSSKGAGLRGDDEDDRIVLPWTSVRIRLSGSPGSAQMTSPGASSNGTVSATNTFSSSTVVYYPGVDLQPYSSAPHPLRTRTVNSLMFKISDTERSIEIMEEIAGALRRAHRLQKGQLDDFELRDRSQFITMLTSTSETVSTLLLVVAMISLVVGGVGIMNIMMVSVSERTREIGLRMAVGARPRDIMSQFLLEAVLLCVVGGIFGIGLGRLASTFVSINNGWVIERSTEAMILSVSVAAVIGIVFGWYPAYKASRMDPIDALRHE